VLAALGRGERRILLDMSGVSFIDSSGIGELVAAYSAAMKEGAVVRVCCLSDRAFNLFQVIALLRVFDVRESEQDGLAAFSAGASR
jgi:anti-sigma B factor antagonist